MIYETAVPVSHARHGNWSLEVGANYAFCRNINAVPLMAAEFASAALEYAVVFGGTGEAVMPVAVLGVRTDENLYVTMEGGWQAKYIPAFVRRYPFVFSSGHEGKSHEGKRFTLCIDETFPGFNQSGRGERLFGDDGKPTPYVENVLKFLGQYQREFQRTEAFCKKLKDLNLLKPMQAQIKLGSGGRMALGGFSVVDRARLKTLSGNVLAQLVQSDELELIYAHLVSMRNFATVGERLAETQPAHSAGGAPLIH
jgi:SapC